MHRAAALSWEFIQCFWMKLVFLSRQISTVTHGNWMHRLFGDLSAAPGAVLLERSRSGNGGHVWIFFRDAIPAALARKLASHILTEAMECRPEIGFKSYDRLFPNQDTLPKGGFGNLIALPLQKHPRQRGNSIFLDEDLQPCADQWALLASAQRMERTRVEAVVREAESKGRITCASQPQKRTMTCLGLRHRRAVERSPH